MSSPLAVCLNRASQPLERTHLLLFAAQVIAATPFVFHPGGGCCWPHPSLAGRSAWARRAEGPAAFPEKNKAGYPASQRERQSGCFGQPVHPTKGSPMAGQASHSMRVWLRESTLNPDPVGFWTSHCGGF